MFLASVCSVVPAAAVEGILEDISVDAGLMILEGYKPEEVPISRKVRDVPSPLRLSLPSPSSFTNEPETSSEFGVFSISNGNRGVRLSSVLRLGLRLELRVRVKCGLRLRGFGSAFSTLISKDEVGVSCSLLCFRARTCGSLSRISPEKIAEFG